jgi:plastocyanin
VRVLGPARRITILALVLFGACALLAETGVQPVTVKVEIVSPRDANKPVAKAVTTKDLGDASNIVIWLKSLNPTSLPAAMPAAGHATPQVAQSNKSFDPHVLVIEAGTPVQFPNKDPFLHNVFSLFEGKRFDLGFYEAGSSKTVHFDRPGVSFLFCNIHPEMSGAVIVVDTPYFGISDRTGRVSIANVPDGRYELSVWYERSLPEDLKAAGRTVTISDSTRTLETVRVVENPNFTLEHKNKYGQDYIPPANTTPAYNHP